MATKIRADAPTKRQVVAGQDRILDYDCNCASPGASVLNPNRPQPLAVIRFAAWKRISKP
jgi:hypothetical protein